MKEQEIIQQIAYFFQTTSCPHIFEKNVNKDTDLNQLLSQQTISLQKSIEIMGGVINAIIGLTTHLFTPTQIRSQHIVCSNGKWGLQGAVCYRYKQRNNKNFLVRDSIQDFIYNQNQAYMHLNQQSQLVWNLGKIWFWILTEREINIDLQQDDIFQIIEDLVGKNNKVGQILFGMLRQDPKNRMSIEEIIKSGLFQPIPTNDDQINDQINFLDVQSSLVKHFSKLSFNCRQLNNDTANPFNDYLFYRQFTQQLQIDDFMRETKKFIKNQFHHFNSTQIELSYEIIDAQRYFRFKQLDQQREKQGFKITLLTDRKIYSQFTNRMYMLQNQLQKISKKQKYRQISALYPQLFVDFSLLTPATVYAHFKGYLGGFIKDLRTRLKNDLSDIDLFRKIAKLYIVRTSNYVFKSRRSFIFQDFKVNGMRVKQILKTISQSQDFYAIRDLQRKIQQTYFKKLKI